MSDALTSPAVAYAALGQFARPDGSTGQPGEIVTAFGLAPPFTTERVNASATQGTSGRMQEISLTGGFDLSQTTITDLGNLSRSVFVNATAQHLSFFGVLTSAGEQPLIAPANTLVQRIISLSANMYEKALSKCREIVEAIDMDDEESRTAARHRMQDIFSIFAEMSELLLTRLSQDYGDNTEVIGFLLSDVLVGVDDIRPGLKVTIVSNFLNNPKASVRYEAVRTLDMLGSSVVRPALEALLSREPNEEVKALLNATTRHG